MLRTFLAFILMFLSHPCSAAASDLAGGWVGGWTKHGDTIPVTITFKRVGQSWKGEFDSDLLEAAGIPIIAIGVVGSRVHFEVEGDNSRTVFNGIIGPHGLSGTFIDGDQSGQFRFTRIARPRPPILSQQVKFKNGDVTLAGTLLMPRRTGRAPAVMFLQGSGPEGRWANRWLAQKFVQSGFAALIYDKRGVGESTGHWQTEGFDVLASDGAAGVRFLRTLPMIDAAKVGIYGHSQGGSVAPLVDRDVGGLAFIIASSAPGLRPAEVERYSVENSIGLDTLPEKERGDVKEYASAIIDVAYHGAPRSTLDWLADRFKDRSWFFAPPPGGDPYWKLSSAIASFDPSVAWAHVKAPVLLVYGARDKRVPPLASLNAIKAALLAGGNRNVSTKLYPDADHVFTIVGAGRSKGWPKHQQDYADTLIAWAKQALIKRGGVVRETAPSRLRTSSSSPG